MCSLSSIASQSRICVSITRQSRVDNPLWQVRPDSNTPKIYFMRGFGLRSASGEREAVAEMSVLRIAAGAQRPPPSRRRKSAAHATNTNVARGERARSETENALVTADEGLILL
jgi:hypothetical protein